MATRRIQWQLSLKDRASQGLKNVGDSAQQADEGVTGLKDSAGEADSVMQGMAGALDQVAPGLAEVFRTAGDAAGGLEAMARSGAASVGALGALGAAVAAVGAAYVVMKAQAEQASNQIERSAEVTGRAVSSFEALASVRRQIAGEEKVQSEERAATLSAEVNANNELIAALKDQITEHENFATHAPTWLIGLKAVDAAYGGLTNRAQDIENLTGQINALALANEKLAETDLGFEAEGEKATRVDFPRAAPRTAGGSGVAASSPFDDSSGVWRSAVMQMEEAQTAFASLALSSGVVGAEFLEMSAGIASLPIGEQAAAYGDLAKQLETTLRATDALTREQAKLAQQAERSAEIEAQRADRESARQRSRGLSAGLGAAQGDVGGALGMLGPYGAAISAALSIGEMGASGVEAKLDSLQDKVAGFFTAVPQLIGEVVPNFIAGITEAGPAILAEAFVPTTQALVGFLARLPVLMIESTISGLVDAFGNKAMWSAMVQALVDGFRRMIASLFPKGGTSTRTKAARFFAAPGLNAAEQVVRMVRRNQRRQDFGVT